MCLSFIQSVVTVKNPMLTHGAFCKEKATLAFHPLSLGHPGFSRETLFLKLWLSGHCISENRSVKNELERELGFAASQPLFEVRDGHECPASDSEAIKRILWSAE
jgi:hypothetical protein